MSINIAARGGSPLSDATPQPVTPGSAGAAGVLADAQRGDHEHPAEDVPSATALAGLIDGRVVTYSAPVTPAAPPAGTTTAVAWEPGNANVFVGYQSAPFVSAYSWDGAALGARVDVIGLTGGAAGVAVTAAGDFVAAAAGGAPARTVSVWPWDGSAFGSRIFPAVQPGSGGEGVAFSPADDFIAVGHSGSPFLGVFPWDGVAFGTVIVPGTLPTGTVRGVAFSPDGNFIAVAHSNGSVARLSVYPWDGVALGTPVSPSVEPAGATAYHLAWSSDGNFIAVASDGTPFVFVYPWDGAALGTRITGPAVTASAHGVDFAPDQAFVGAAMFGTPSTAVVAFDGTALGPVTVPGTPPAGLAEAVAFSGDGVYVAVGHFTTPFLTIYEGQRALGF